MKKEEITLEMLRALLPSRTSLTYVGYNESLDGLEEEMQQCIQEGDLDALSDKVQDAFWEQEADSERKYKEELVKDAVNKYDLEEEEVQELVFETFEDELRDTIYDRDDSNALKDLLGNTGRVIAHYDTGFYVEEGWRLNDKEIMVEVQKIKKELGIRTKECNERLRSVVRNAQGGEVKIYFELELEDFINNESPTIIFRNPNIGVIDHGQGSGDYEEFPGLEIKLPYRKENIFLEKTIKYNWTYAIAGMCSDWCSNVAVSFSDKKTNREMKESKQTARTARDNEYKRVFKSGSCTYGDIDITRHRNATYINDYPCGNKCPDCGQFWID